MEVRFFAQIAGVIERIFWVVITLLFTAAVVLAIAYVIRWDKGACLTSEDEDILAIALLEEELEEEGEA